jgi:hypothetical protein
MSRWGVLVVVLLFVIYAVTCIWLAVQNGNGC